jgi:hypothetical protein
LFTPETERVLRQAGWFPGRCIDENVLEEWLVIHWNAPTIGQLGYSKIFPASWRALQEFGGIRIEEGVGTKGLRESFEINPHLVAQCDPFSHDWHTEEWILGKCLFPLGVVWGCTTGALAMDTEGKVYYLGECTLFLGNTMETALETLVSGRDAEEIPDDKQSRLDAASTIPKIVRQINPTANV